MGLGLVRTGEAPSLAGLYFHLVSGHMVPKGSPTVKGLSGPWTACLTWGFTPVPIFSERETEAQPHPPDLILASSHRPSLP